MYNYRKQHPTPSVVVHETPLPKEQERTCTMQQSSDADSFARAVMALAHTGALHCCAPHSTTKTLPPSWRHGDRFPASLASTIRDRHGSMVRNPPPHAAYHLRRRVWHAAKHGPGDHSALALVQSSQHSTNSLPPLAREPPHSHATATRATQLRLEQLVGTNS